MNDAFRDAYAERRAAMVAASGPVLVQIGDRLVLYRGGERLEGPATNARYHALKSVAHVPFAIYLMLAPVDGPIDAARVQRLTAYRALVKRAAKTVEGHFVEAAQRERQRRILSRSLSLLDRAIADKGLPAAALRAFVKEVRAEAIENVYDAAREQIMTMHAQVKAWSARMTKEELGGLRVVVGTVHMARPGNLSVQYFEAWLGGPYAGHLADERVTESERVIVGEEVFDEEHSLALLGTHLVDRDAATVFFDDPLRLDRDLLSDMAEKIIPEILGPTPEASARR